MLDPNELWFKQKCYTSEGPYLLPFAPNINWKSASVFIVGLNPTGSFRDEFDSFEHYWQALTRHPDTYKKIHQEKYLRRPESRTSKRIRYLTEWLDPVNVLVTNTFAYPTTNPLFIPTHIRREPVGERLLSRLLRTCKPKVVFFHGAEARKFGEAFFGVKLNPYLEPSRQPVIRCIPDTDSVSSLFAYHHLVGRVETKDVTDMKLRQFAERILQRV
ncbi:MAG TPA: hypothetical protein VIP46_17985 [Pyrinomonadaceae bacterium]